MSQFFEEPRSAIGFLSFWRMDSTQNMNRHNRYISRSPDIAVRRSPAQKPRRLLGSRIACASRDRSNIAQGLRSQRLTGRLQVLIQCPLAFTLQSAIATVGSAPVDTRADPRFSECRQAVSASTPRSRPAHSGTRRCCGSRESIHSPAPLPPSVLFQRPDTRRECGSEDRAPSYKSCRSRLCPAIALAVSRAIVHFGGCRILQKKPDRQPSLATLLESIDNPGAFFRAREP